MTPEQYNIRVAKDGSVSLYNVSIADDGSVSFGQDPFFTIAPTEEVEPTSVATIKFSELMGTTPEDASKSIKKFRDWIKE